MESGLVFLDADGGGNLALRPAYRQRRLFGKGGAYEVVHPRGAHERRSVSEHLRHRDGNGEGGGQGGQAVERLGHRLLDQYSYGSCPLWCDAEVVSHRGHELDLATDSPLVQRTGTRSAPAGICQEVRGETRDAP